MRLTKKIVLVSIALNILALVPINVFAEEPTKLQDIYHVYKNDNHIGNIIDKDKLEQHLKLNLQKEQETYSSLTLTYMDDISVIKEKVFNINEATLDDPVRVANSFEVGTVANSIYLDGQSIGNVPVDMESEEITLEIIKPFLGQNDRIDTSFKPEDINSLKVGESVITNIEISPSIKVIKSTVFPEEINSIDKIKDYLLVGPLKEDSYTIQEGDVLGTIAQKFNLTIDQLMQLNPQLSLDTVLKIGDVLNVQMPQPLIKVDLTRLTKVAEEIPYNTIIKEDANLFKGESYKETSGVEGQKEVIYKTSTSNNEITQETIIHEQVVKEKVDEVIVKGTKVIPSRGTGKFIWPTNGGVITTYQGMRWGKFHKGIDIAGPRDYSILTADNGKVTFAGWINGYGNVIKINHNNGYTTQYSHLNSINVETGKTVVQGEKIGVMGSTGYSTGIHLDFEVYYNGNLVNPLDVLP